MSHQQQGSTRNQFVRQCLLLLMRSPARVSCSTFHARSTHPGTTDSETKGTVSSTQGERQSIKRYGAPVVVAIKIVGYKFVKSQNVSKISNFLLQLQNVLVFFRIRNLRIFIASTTELTFSTYSSIFFTSDHHTFLQCI